MYSIKLIKHKSDRPDGIVDKIVGIFGRQEPIKEGSVCQTEAGTEADMEDNNVDVVAGVDEVGVSGYESEGFTL